MSHEETRCEDCSAIIIGPGPECRVCELTRLQSFLHSVSFDLDNSLTGMVNSPDGWASNVDGLESAYHMALVMRCRLQRPDLSRDTVHELVRRAECTVLKERFGVSKIPLFSQTKDMDVAVEVLGRTREIAVEIVRDEPSPPKLERARSDISGLCGDDF